MPRPTRGTRRRARGSSSAGVNAVLAGAAGGGPSVQALKDAGIPVVTVNSSVDKSLVPDMFCYVAEDQEHTGSLAGEVAAQRALEKYGDKGKIKIVGIGGFPGA